MHTLIAYRFVVSLALSVVMGVVGLHVRPFVADNLLLELIHARRPPYALRGLERHLRQPLVQHTDLAISGVCAWLYIVVARTGYRGRLRALPPSPVPEARGSLPCPR
jgi:hypothetical protein